MKKEKLFEKKKNERVNEKLTFYVKLRIVSTRMLRIAKLVRIRHYRRIL